MKTTVFVSRGCQAVRIPEEMRIDAKHVEIERIGATLVLRPVSEENSWPEGYLESFAGGRLEKDFIRHPQRESRHIG